MSDEKWTLTIPDTDEGLNNIQLYAVNENLHIEVDNPWAGDTETGLGQTSHVMLDREQVLVLRDFIEGWLSTLQSCEGPG